MLARQLMKRIATQACEECIWGHDLSVWIEAGGDKEEGAAGPFQAGGPVQNLGGGNRALEIS